MKFKTAKIIKEIKDRINWEPCYNSEVFPPENRPSQVLMSSLEFERALVLAYAAGIEAGKKNPNEAV